MNTIQNPSFYVTYIVTILVFGGILWFLHQHDPVTEVVNNDDKDITVKVSPELSPLSGMPPEWKKSWEEKLEKQIPANVLSEVYPITDENREEIMKMLAQFEPLKNKSETEIIQILYDFYPEENRDEVIYQFFVDFYKSFPPDKTREFKVFAMVHFMQQCLSIIRESKEEVENSEELRQRDPDAYYAAEIQAVKAKVPEIEEHLRNAETRGDTSLTDYYRNVLDAIPEEIESLNMTWDFAVRDRPGSKWQQEIDARVQQQLEEWEKNPPEWLKPYQQAIADVDKFLDEFEKELASMELERGKSIVPSESPSVSPVSPSGDIEPSSTVTEVVAPSQPSAVSTFDPVRSVASAYAAFRPFRADLDKKYFDVVVSQYMTPAEFEKFFPTEAERQQLQRRTAELRKSVVSKVREVISGVKGATPGQKRQLARELVSANYGKDFAESVLKALEQDVEE